VLFVIAGGLLVVRWPRVAWAHLPAAAWGAWVEFAGWVCPLTPMENWLRQQGGQTVYTTSFVEEYFLPILYPPALTREIQWMLGALVLAVNAVVYLVAMRRRVGRSKG
jgi:hypothetical protein